ncbi:hypothetical protein M9Y10_044278 [Tritrichomonas musculus]|uniref:Importin subunit beta-1/Transportin-1-like TPR repeats domain-containing protein n=1 Tax=Tritrichomonas musculus TaxID=1915356 RepID=A0ABR2K202_9EUKA
MEAVDDQTLLQQLNQALVAATSNSDEERNPATQFILEIKRRDPKQYTFMLILHLSDVNNHMGSRALAAILIYSILHQRTIDSQKKFNQEWVKNVNPEVRDRLRIAATIGLFTDSPSFSTQCANLLGLFYSIEILYGNFKQQLEGILEIAATSQNLNERIASLSMFKRFQQSCFEYNPNCFTNSFLQPVAKSLFNVLISGMTSGNQEIAHAAIDTLINPLKFYEREISFTKNTNIMMNIDIDFIQNENDSIALDGYTLTRKMIEHYSDLIGAFLQTLLQSVEQAFNTGSENRKIAACSLLQTIGEVESQNNENADQPNSNLQRNFFTLNGYSSKILEVLFNPLVAMICNCPIEDTDVKVSVDKTLQMAAISCFSYLARAADATALKPIFDFVTANGSDQDWRLRFCSIMLLNAATTIPSFGNKVQSSSNYLIAFNFFCQMISDPIPRNVEASFWSLGQIINEDPELVTDPQRFAMVCSVIPTVLNTLPALSARCCWILHIVFRAFENVKDGSSQLLAANFDQFAEMLLMTSDSNDSDTVCAAYAAIYDLVSFAPDGIEEQYNRLFEKITARLARILQETEGNLRTTLELNRTIWICYIIHAITMIVGDRITVIADQLMSMLFQLIHSSNGILISEVLPCIGAVARAIKDKFTPYAEQLIPLLDNLLQSNEYIQPAAVLIGDLYSSLESLPTEVTDRFVHSLLEAFNYDYLTKAARNRIMSVLGTQIAQNIQMNCLPWLDTFLERLKFESRAAVEEKETIDYEYAEKIHITILLCFKTFLPILSNVPNGFRKVKSFFYIFDQIYPLTAGSNDVLFQAVELIGQTANLFGRKLNVVLNRSAVRSLLKEAMKSEDEDLAKMGSQVYEIVRKC